MLGKANFVKGRQPVGSKLAILFSSATNAKDFCHSLQIAANLSSLESINVRELGVYNLHLIRHHAAGEHAKQECLNE